MEQVKAQPASARQWFDKAAALEPRDTEAALAAYERAIALDPGLLDAQINRGCLLHETGRLAEAERAYRGALDACRNAPALFYNLATVLEDLGRKEQAVEAYKDALKGDPRLADCHYNLSLLYEELGQVQGSHSPYGAVPQAADSAPLVSETHPGRWPASCCLPVVGGRGACKGLKPDEFSSFLTRARHARE